MNLVWVTGAKGFIAGHLIRYARDQGAAVAGIGHGNLTPRRREELQLTAWVNGDVTGDDLQVLTSRTGVPQAIFHLAGGSSVGPSFDHPVEDYRRTVDSTREVLEWVRLSGTAIRVIFASSAAVYGAAHHAAIPEDAVLAPFSPYGSHKAMAEILLRSYAANFQIHVAIVRLFSVFGEGLEKQLIFDLCERLATRPRELILSGTGEELRDWMHVSDVVRLLWLVGGVPLDDVLVVNGGTGAATRVAEVARIVSNRWKSEAEIRFSEMNRPGDPSQLVAEPTRLHQLGFRNAVTLSEGLDRVVAWYRQRTAAE